MVLGPLSAFAQSTEVAHISLQELLSSMPEWVSAEEELVKLNDSYVNDIQNSEKELQAKMQAYQAEAQNMSDLKNSERQQEIQDMARRLQEYEQAANQELNKKRQDLLAPLAQKAQEAIIKVGKELGFKYVLNSDRGGPLLLSDGKDILEDVKRELGF